jgi:formylglycine-generating enzyme required for sulfatase activity
MIAPTLVVCSLASLSLFAQETRAADADTRPSFTVRARTAHEKETVDQAVADAVELDGAPWSVTEERTGIVFVLIPGGQKTLGVDIAEEQRRYASSKRSVVVKSFYMAAKELSLLEWKKGWGQDEVRRMGADQFDTQLDDCALDIFKWRQAFAYCERVGIRMPTEDEWEYSSTIGGDETDSEALEERLPQFAVNRHLAGFSSSYFYSTPLRPRGTKKPNRFGLFDVFGNLSEWIQGDAGPFAAEDRRLSSDGETLVVMAGNGGYVKPKSGSLLRITKGGSVNTKSKYLSASRRALIVQEWDGPTRDDIGRTLAFDTNETGGMTCGLRPAVDRAVVMQGLRQE